MRCPEEKFSAVPAKKINLLEGAAGVL